MAAVAVFAVGVGGFFTGLQAFGIFAVTMGVLIALIATLGASAGQGLVRPLRAWGGRIQVVGALMIVLVGVALIYAGINPGFWDRLVLG